MHLPARVERVIPPSDRHIGWWLRLLAVPVVAAVIVLGIWITGGVITDDFELAQLLTGVFLAAAGAAAVVAGLRWRSLALPVIVTFAMVAGVLGGYLLVTSNRDVVVTEDVAMVAEQMQPAAGVTPMSPAPGAGTMRVAAGEFRSGEHTTTGAAEVLRLGDGSHVVTLTDLDTSPGPDLRVYLVPGNGESVRGHLDLGHLKGNRGNQQYAVPDGADLTRYGAVVIWCRAFTVAFGSAALN